MQASLASYRYTPFRLAVISCVVCRQGVYLACMINFPKEIFMNHAMACVSAHLIRALEVHS